MVERRAERGVVAGGGDAQAATVGRALEVEHVERAPRILGERGGDVEQERPGARERNRG